MFTYNEQKSYIGDSKREGEVSEKKVLEVSQVASEELDNISNPMYSPRSLNNEIALYKETKYFRRKFDLKLKGLKETQLFEKTGIKDLIFVNEKRTIACGFTLKSVLTLAEHCLYN